MKPEAFEAVFHEFTASSFELAVDKQTSQYQFIAADGSSILFSSLPRFALDEYYISEGHSASGFYSMHINAFYDLNRHIYDVMSLLKKELIPVRPDKQFPRLKTAHFRKPKYLIYRAA